MASTPNNNNPFYQYETYNTSSHISSDETRSVLKYVLIATGCCYNPNELISQREADTLLRQLEGLSWTRLLRTFLEASVLGVSNILGHENVNKAPIIVALDQQTQQGVTIALLLVAKSVVQRNWRSSRKVETWGTTTSSWSQGRNDMNSINDNNVHNEQNRLMSSFPAHSIDNSSNTETAKAAAREASEDNKNKELIKIRLLSILESLAYNVQLNVWNDHVDFLFKFLYSIAQIIRRICRYEFPHRWPELLPTLNRLTHNHDVIPTSSLSTSSPSHYFTKEESSKFPAPGTTVSYPAIIHIITLYFAVKEQASKRLPVALHQSEALGPDLLETILPWWIWIDTVETPIDSLTDSNYIKNTKVFKYIEKSFLLIACYFFRSPLSAFSSNRGVTRSTRLNPPSSSHNAEISTSCCIKLPPLIIKQILHRSSHLLNRFQEYVLINDNLSTRNGFDFFATRMNSIWKLLPAFAEKLHVKLHENEIKLLLTQSLHTIKRLHSKLECDYFNGIFCRWVSNFFRFFSALVSTEVQHSFAGNQLHHSTRGLEQQQHETGNNYELVSTEPLRADQHAILEILTPESNNIWECIRIALEAAVFDAHFDIASLLASSTAADATAETEEATGRTYLRGNDEVTSAIQALIIQLFQTSCGVPLETYIIEWTNQTTQQFMDNFTVKDSFDDASLFAGQAILKELNIIALFYLISMTGWTDIGNGDVEIPQFLYQKSATSLLRLTMIDVITSFSKREQQNNYAFNNYKALYFLYIARCISFIKTWAEAIHMGKLSREDAGCANVLNVGTAMPILLVLACLQFVPIPTRVLAISASAVLFDAFLDHPVWWLGISQLPPIVLDHISKNSPYVVRAAVDEQSSISDLFSAAAVDLLSVVKSSEAASECLTLTLKILAATLEPDDEHGAREGRSSLISVTSEEEETSAANALHIKHIRARSRQHQSYRESLLIAVIERTWCSTPVTTITPTHSIVLDNLVFLLIMQWSRYEANNGSLLVSSPHNSSLAVNFHNQQKNQIACMSYFHNSNNFVAYSGASSAAIRAAHCAITIFNLALEGCLSGHEVIWFPYWCKIGNIMDEFLRLFLIVPDVLTVASIHTFSKGYTGKYDDERSSFLNISINNTILSQNQSNVNNDTSATIDYLNLTAAVSSTYMRILDWIVSTLNTSRNKSFDDKLPIQWKLIDGQIMEICMEFISILVQSEMARQQQLEPHSSNSSANATPYATNTLTLVQLKYDDHDNTKENYMLLGLTSEALKTLNTDLLYPTLQFIQTLLISNYRIADNNHYESDSSSSSSSISSTSGDNDTACLGLQIVMQLMLLPILQPDFFLIIFREVLKQTFMQFNILSTIVASQEELRHSSRCMEFDQTQQQYNLWPLITNYGWKTSVFNFLASAIIHRPLLMRQALENLVVHIFPGGEAAVSTYHDDATKAAIFGFILLLLETLETQITLYKASVATSVIQHLLLHIPLSQGSTLQPENAKNNVCRLWMNSVIGIIILLLRQLTEVHEATPEDTVVNYQSNRSSCKTRRPYSPSTALLLNTNCIRGNKRISGSSRSGRFYRLDLQFNSTNYYSSPQLKRYFMPKSPRFRSNLHRCLVLPAILATQNILNTHHKPLSSPTSSHIKTVSDEISKNATSFSEQRLLQQHYENSQQKNMNNADDGIRNISNSSSFAPNKRHLDDDYPIHLKYFLKAMSSWLLIVQEEQISIIDNIAQLLNNARNTSERGGTLDVDIPSFKSLFGDTRKNRHSSSGAVLDEIDVDTAQKGLNLLQAYSNGKHDDDRGVL